MALSEQLRIGLIGCGYQGSWLAQTVAQMDGLRLTGCVDPDLEAAAKVIKIDDGARRFESVEALLAADEIDAVFVATPHHLLQPYALQAIQAGKHVLAEKPIALNAKEAEELEAAVAATGVTYMSGYSFRYFEQPARAKQLISAGTIGEIQTISAGITRPGLRQGWPSDPASGGGIMGFYGCHMVDRVLWYLQDTPVELSANVSYYPETGVDQNSIFQVSFESGAIAQFNICGTAGAWFDYLHICGSSGHIYLALANIPNYILTVSSWSDDAFAVPQTFSSDLDRGTAILNKLTAELRDFAQAVNDHGQPPISVSDGRKVLEILDAVAVSGRTGQPVQL